MDKEKENALRMLDGCICRLSVTDSKEEAYSLFHGVTYWAMQILNHTIRRISDQEEQKQEGGVQGVRRTRRKRRTETNTGRN